MKKRLLIYGAGGLGKEVLALVNSTDSFEVIGFIDDGIKRDSSIKGIKVLGGREVLDSLDTSTDLVIALGDPVSKSKVLTGIKNSHINFPILRHPSVILQDPSAIEVGSGSIFCAGTILTTDIKIGSHVLINLNCTIGHGVTIGNNSSLMPGVNVAGEVSIGPSVLIGSGVNILNRVSIGANCIVGMGSVVIRDVAPDMTIAGVPAKSIRR